MILPGLVLIGVGLGLVFGCAMNAATYGTAATDAGVASAMVNTCQQVGGSIGTALLNTIAASALSSYLLAHGHSPAAIAGAAVHSYVVAFWVSAAIFAAAAVVCGAGAAAGRPRATGGGRGRRSPSPREASQTNAADKRRRQTMTSDQTRLVTVSASYGAGGSVVAPALARAARRPFPATGNDQRRRLARGPEPCAERLAAGRGRPHAGAPAARLVHARDAGRPHPVTAVAPPSGRAPAPPLRGRHSATWPPPARASSWAGARRWCSARTAGSTCGSTGRQAQRVAQGAAIEGVSYDEARRHIETADRARTAYVRRLYRADPADPRHYHLLIDSTAIPLDAVVEIILRALSSFPATNAASPAPPASSSAAAQAQ